MEYLKMNIYNMNIVKLKDQALLCQKTKEKFIPNLTITNPTTFLTQSLVVFSNVKLVRNSKGLISCNDTFNACPSKIHTPNGFMTAENFKALLVVLFYTQRSFFIRNMTKDPSLGSFTPLFMYAHKLYNDVEYEEWDKEDSKICWALGKLLTEAIEKAPKERVDISDYIDEYRKSALTYLSGKKQGQIESLLAYKMPQKLKIYNGTILYRSVLQMLLQTWICNVEVRDEHSMILDPWNWDLTPEPIDQVISKKAQFSTMDLV